MKTRLTTLAENTVVAPGLLAEQGLSVLVEAGEHTFLLDTGQTASAVNNALALGIDLATIEAVVLSHGHFDHTGGLRSLLQHTRRPTGIVAHPDVWAQKYDVRKDRPSRFIGIPFQRPELESRGAEFRLSHQPVELAPSVTTLGEVPMMVEYETIDPHLKVLENGEYLADALLDDQGLVIDTGDGIVVVLGCAHRGLINSLRRAVALTGVDKISLVVGGSHLIGADEERVWRTVASIKELGVERLGLCHCTSLPAAAIMAREFGDRFFFNSVGTRVEAGR